jgi:ribosomal protein S17E
MKTFRQYLSEGKQTFKYDVKIAHDLEPDQIKGIITRLSKTFDVIEPEKIKPIVTPVESSPNGFPEVKNQSVTILKLEFKYPVTEPQIIQVIRLATGIEDKYVRAFTPEFEESMNQTLLNTADSKQESASMSKDYSESFLNRLEQNQKSIEFKFASDEINSKKMKTMKQIQSDQLKTVSNKSPVGSNKVNREVV